MSIIPRLAHSLRRRDELPNQELAQKIAAAADEAAVAELVTGLQHKVKDLQHDCIKVLYEIGRIMPSLIARYLPVFLGLLKSSNNRMQWGAMCAIDSLSSGYAEKVYAALPQIIEAADNGSVITRDHAVSILVKLGTIKKFSENAFELLIAQLRTCPVNQLAMYAEKALTITTEGNKSNFVDTLRLRLPELESAAKRKRVEQVISKVASTLQKKTAT